MKKYIKLFLNPTNQVGALFYALVFIICCAGCAKKDTDSPKQPLNQMVFWEPLGSPCPSPEDEYIIHMTFDRMEFGVTVSVIDTVNYIQIDQVTFGIVSQLDTVLITQTGCINPVNIAFVLNY